MILSSLTEGVGLLLLVPILGVVSEGQVSANPLIQRLVGVTQGLGLPISLGGLLVFFLILVGLRSTVQYSRERLAAHLQYRVVDGLRLHCFSALMGVEWRWIVGDRKSDHANVLLSDVGRVGVGLNFGIGLLVSLITALAYLSTAFVLSWAMTVLALLSGALVFRLLSGQRRAALALGHSLGRANKAMQGNVQESLAGIKLTKILGNEQRTTEYFVRTTRNLRQQLLGFTAGTSLSRALFQMGGAVLTAFYVYVGITVLNMPLPELAVLVMLLARLIPMLMNAHQHYHHWLHAMPAVEEINALLVECGREAEPGPDPGQENILIKDLISLDNVTVSYKSRGHAALTDVSLSLPVRTTTAIIGPSGAGKSTLADVLVGLLEPDSGRMRIDGETVSGGRRTAWRRSVAYVPQDVFLFHDTVRNNLLWGAPGAGEDELRRALGRAAADFVDELPEGLDTVIGDGGVLLSGGERQRLALARALLKMPSLLILDEATSALDTENEARIRKAIEKLHGDLTVVIIGHRLPTLEHADKVMVLEKGRVAAEGTWHDIHKQQRRR